MQLADTPTRCRTTCSAGGKGGSKRNNDEKGRQTMRYILGVKAAPLSSCVPLKAQTVHCYVAAHCCSSARPDGEMVRSVEGELRDG